MEVPLSEATAAVRLVLLMGTAACCLVCSRSGCDLWLIGLIDSGECTAPVERGLKKRGKRIGPFSSSPAFLTHTNVSASHWLLVLPSLPGVHVPKAVCAKVQGCHNPTAGHEAMLCVFQ